MTTSLASERLPGTRPYRWFYALKPASWPKLVVPALFGQLLGARISGGLDLGAFGWGFGFTAFGLAFIVLLNDWGDREVDTIKRRMFPEGCSPKTIPDEILDARSVGAAGLACGLVAIALSVGAERSLGRGWALEAGAACVALFVIYTLPPVRLNYRGGGEVVEMLGVGVALPIYNIYLQAGIVPNGVWPWIAGFAALSLASAVASGLSDEQSDRVGGKRTFASMFGNRAARRLTEGALLLGVSIWTGAALFGAPVIPTWPAGAAIAIVMWNFAALRRVSGRAVTNEFRAQAEYKHFLHRAIWHSTTVAAVLVWLPTTLS
jgi:1,4-dihydroxy-2-naphthoate octaprenyltransferase/chlorophyll synthase